jgi:carboxylesterase
LASNGRCVLCLHGFTGTPFEIQPVADRLSQLGYHVDAPMLAGHGGDLANLEATGWPDWLRSAEQAFDAMAISSGASASGRIAVVGFSMGGLLALRLAQRRPDRIAALAVLSVPLRLRTAQVRGIRLLGRIPRGLRWGPLRAVPKLRGSDVSDPEVRRLNPGLRAMPVAGLESLLELMVQVRGELKQTRVPALVVHGRRDRTVPIADSFELADSLAGQHAMGSAGSRARDESAGDPSATVERLWLDRSGHLVGVDVERDILCDTIARFLATRADW